MISVSGEPAIRIAVVVPAPPLGTFKEIPVRALPAESGVTLVERSREIPVKEAPLAKVAAEP